MKIKRIDFCSSNKEQLYCDISTRNGNFVIDNGCVVHNSHITVLLVTAFLRMFPELIKSGRVYKSILPLYGVNNYNGKFLPFYTEEEMIKEKNIMLQNKEKEKKKKG